MRIFDLIERWAGRVEVTLSGADLDFREARDALNRGEAMRARAAAKRVLARAPNSIVGLAVLADACELAGLYAELAMTLEELVERSPSQAALWLRLAQVSARINEPAAKIEEKLTTALGLAEPGSTERRESILSLAALAMAQGEPQRAELWLTRLPVGDSLVALRLGEALLAQRRVDSALAVLRQNEPDPIDAEHNRALGEALAINGSQECYPYLLRAVMLDDPRASDILSSAIGWIQTDETMLAKARTLISSLGQESELRWKVAFARAEGRSQDARDALVAATAADAAGAAEALLDLAIHTVDDEALSIATKKCSSEKGIESRKLVDALRLPLLEALTLVATVHDPELDAFARRVAERITAAWLDSNSVSWEALFERLSTHARAVNALDELGKISALAAEQVRPVRLAVIGEFNAGKSTFINAWMGAAHAPMGIVPTTATLHHLRYARDPIARLVFRADEHAADRIVALPNFREALASAKPGSLDHVELMLPIVALTSVELLDTPGFNALDPAHAEAARRALSQADAVLYLLDANQAMRDSDRQVLELVKTLDLPVQVIVNKADRLASEEQSGIEALIAKGLTQLDVTSLRAPIFVSAKDALAAKLGGTELAQSGWLTIDKLIEEEFVGQSLAIKSRSIARAATAVATSLERRYDEAQCAEREVAARQERETVLIFDALQRCEADPAEIARRIGAHLQLAHARWLSEAALVFEPGGAGPLLSRARALHAESFLAGPLCRALADAMAPAVEDPVVLQLVVRTIAQGCASSTPDLETLSLTALAGLTGLLRVRTAPRATRSELGRQTREISAIVAALQMGRAQTVAGGTLQARLLRSVPPPA